MTVLREYIEQVVTELARDEKFIRHLKASRSRQVVGIAELERFADEWLATQRAVKPEEARLARRVAIDKFPELLERTRGDVTAAKRALFSVLASTVIKKKAAK